MFNAVNSDMHGAHGLPDAGAAARLRLVDPALGPTRNDRRHVHDGVDGPRISRNLLTQRLVSLAGAGIIERRRAARGRGFAYHLTPAGEELRPVVDALGAWGYRWGGTDLPSKELNPVLLMWFVRRRVQVTALRRGRTVIRFDFRRPRRSFWLRIEPPAVDLCFTDEGFDVELEVDADLAALTAVWLGRKRLDEAIAAGSIRLEGDDDAEPLFSRWFGLSPFAAGGADRILAGGGAR